MFNFHDVPEELDFHLPGKDNAYENRSATMSSEPELLYQQLVCWCLVQRFWYYVCQLPQVTDYEYDYNERLVAGLEEEFDFSNQHSPTTTVGSDYSLNYPHSIRNFFSSDALGCTPGKFRVAYRESKFVGDIAELGIGDMVFCHCEYCEEYRRLYPEKNSLHTYQNTY